MWKEKIDVVYLFYSAHGWQLQSSLHMSFPPETRDARGLREKKANKLFNLDTENRCRNCGKDVPPHKTHSWPGSIWVCTVNLQKNIWKGAYRRTGFSGWFFFRAHEGTLDVNGLRKKWLKIKRCMRRLYPKVPLPFLVPPYHFWQKGSLFKYFPLENGYPFTCYMKAFCKPWEQS